MSWNICAISSEPIEEPVVSKLTGHMFEQRVIQKQIQATGLCPITNQPLTQADLVDVQGNSVAKPRPVNATSIPNILTILQSEWDALLLQTYNLRQHLDTARQELSHALYQHDASCRVIARLIQQRDQARKDLLELHNQFQVHSNSSQVEIREISQNTLPNSIIASVEQLAVELTHKRRNRQKDPSFIAKFAPLQVISLMKSRESRQLLHPQISALDIHDTLALSITGGVDGKIQISDLDGGQNVASLDLFKGGRINEIILSQLDEKVNFFALSSDQTQTQFVSFDPEQQIHTVQYSYSYSEGIPSIAVHPINFLGLTAHKDGSFAIHELREARLLLQVDHFLNKMQFTSVRVHPDGSFIALGNSSGQIVIWNITDNSFMQEMSSAADSNSVDILSFSENGFILASASFNSGVVNIWDLRNSELLTAIPVDETSQISALAFDLSAQCLAVATRKGDIKLYEAQKYQLITSIHAHDDAITSLKFSNNTHNLYTGGQEGNFNIFTC